ncbi:MAG: ROK family protein [Treponema sp.]|jgi:glucokinase|nr:ROK family protein [Treponema sp.]
MKQEYIGSLDIGGTKTIAAICGTDGTIYEKMQFPTNRMDYVAHFTNCCAILHKLGEKKRITIESLLGVGINMPGMMDYSRGLLLHAPFASWKDLPVRDFFRNLLKKDTVFIDNDVKSCALGEKYFGLKNKYKDYIWVTISTGIGAALVLDGKIYRGNNNLAGELGHIKVEFNNPRICTCGKKGCLEAYASGTAITKSVLQAIEKNPSFIQKLDAKAYSHDAKGCGELAAEGDRIALGIYSDAAEYMARGFASVINLINPQAIILGGGVVNSIDLFLPEIQKRIKNYAVDQASETEIVKTRLGYEAALIGTIALVLENL